MTGPRKFSSVRLESNLNGPRESRLDVEAGPRGQSGLAQPVERFVPQAERHLLLFDHDDVLVLVEDGNQYRQLVEVPPILLREMDGANIHVGEDGQTGLALAQAEVLRAKVGGEFIHVFLREKGPP